MAGTSLTQRSLLCWERMVSRLVVKISALMYNFTSELRNCHGNVPCVLVLRLHCVNV